MDRLNHLLSEVRHRGKVSFQQSYHSALRPVRSIPTRWPLAWFSTWRADRLPLIHHDCKPMTLFSPDAWRRRRNAAIMQLLHIFWVCLTYLVSELAIWGLSRVLAPVKIEFFSSIIGMLLVFICMGVAILAWPPVERVYDRWFKPRVDFINTHIGIGFPVPIIMLNEDDILDGRDIACILGNAVITNVLSWAFVFLLPYLLWTLYLRNAVPGAHVADCRGRPRPIITTPPQIDITWYPEINSDQVTDDTAVKYSRPGTATPSMAATGPISTGPINQDGARTPVSTSSGDAVTEAQRSRSSSAWPTVLAFLCIVVVGVPVTVGFGDGRLLDAFVLWLVWITAVTLQRAFKASRRFHCHPRFKNVSATLMNPVLTTTLLMVGYTRVRAEAGKHNLASILESFSAGSPLYAIWTAQIHGDTLPANPHRWFGAGDAALSLLECGIFIWGFKLFEYRRQLFSPAGGLAILVSLIAALGNVFLSVLAGRAMGLAAPEALAFAARSATLALAKPAIEAVGGNTVVNAALVVGNGIFGQLMYPFTLDLLGVKSESRSTVSQSIRISDREKQEEIGNAAAFNTWGRDDAPTIASGIAIGVNGAAMGVAYLYETRSRAAPYAALSMTIFGVATVVLTTVGPFKALLIGLAGG